MEAPGRLLGWIEQQKDVLIQKEDAVQSLVSQLAARSPASSGSGIAVTRYADAKSIRAVFDLAFYARSKECVIVAPSASFLSSFDEGVMESAKERGVQVRTIFKKNLSAALLIYDDTVVISTGASSATVITSPELATMLSVLL
jgi:hypothetical protein